MIAPLFGVENADVPLMFWAETFTNTLDPHGSSKGEALIEAIGTVQVCWSRIVVSAPLQSAELIVYVVLSRWRN